MDVSEHVRQLRSDGERFASALEEANLESVVPTCPDWTVRDLAVHLGSVHRWATAYVRDGLDVPDADLEATAGPRPSDGGLTEWFRDGVGALASGLRDAPADLSCWTFLDAPSPRAFWARRQAHETAIHRVDLEGVAGPVGAFPPAFAADGIDELLFRFLGRPGRAPRVAAPVTLRLEAVDVAEGMERRADDASGSISAAMCRSISSTPSCAGPRPICTCCSGTGEIRRTRGARRRLGT